MAQTITLQEAIELFPQLLDEKIKTGFQSPAGPIQDVQRCDFQFDGDGDYRTSKLERSKPHKTSHTMDAAALRRYGAVKEKTEDEHGDTRCG